MDSERTNRSGVTQEILGLYIHIPFCKSKCIYCDFSSFSGQEKLYSPYLHALIKEITMRARTLSSNFSVDTIYIGGGTPGAMSTLFIEQLLGALRENFSLREDIEITIEINPENRSEEKFAHYAQWGINRLSVGFQSLNNNILATLGRIHTSEEALKTFETARKAGFLNISIDMIMGLPGHTVDPFLQEVEKVVALKPEHISLYLIELDKETPLVRYLREGKVNVPDEIIMVQLYEEAADLLTRRDYLHYEISNFSLPSKESRHNMKYWTDQPYLGFGSSAHSYLQGDRFSNTCDINEYINRIAEEGSALEQVESFQREKRAAEAIFLGLRLMRGVDQTTIMNRYGINIFEQFDSKIAHLIEIGLLEREGQNLRLTKKGKILSNEVFSQFV